MTGDVAPVKHMKCVVNGILEDEYRKNMRWPNISSRLKFRGTALAQLVA